MTLAALPAFLTAAIAAAVLCWVALVGRSTNTDGTATGPDDLSARAERWLTDAWMWSLITVPLLLLAAGQLIASSAIATNDTFRYATTAGPGIITGGALAALLAVRHRRPNYWGLAVLTLLTATLVVTLIQGQGWPHVVLAACAASPVAVAASSALVTRAWRTALAATAALAVLLVSYTVLQPADAVTYCGGGGSKCLLGDAYLHLSGRGSNAFGVTMAVVGIAAAAQVRSSRRHRALAVTAVCALVAVSGSRTSLAALLLLVPVVAISDLIPNKRLAWGSGILAATTVSALPLVLRLPDPAITYRGLLFRMARGFVAEDPWFGKGISYWVRARISGVPGEATYSPHNLWWSLLVDIGVVGTLCWLAVIAWGLLRTTESSIGPPAAILVGMLAVGTFEATFMPYRIGPFPAFAVLLLASLAWAGPDTTGRPDEPDEHHQLGDDRRR